MSEQTGRLGSARIPSRACGNERVLAIANFSCAFSMPSARETQEKRLFQRDAETSTRDACAPQTTV